MSLGCHTWSHWRWVLPTLILIPLPGATVGILLAISGIFLEAIFVPLLVTITWLLPSGSILTIVGTVSLKSPWAVRPVPAITAVIPPPTSIPLPSPLSSSSVVMLPTTTMKTPRWRLGGFNGEWNPLLLVASCKQWTKIVTRGFVVQFKKG